MYNILIITSTRASLQGTLICKRILKYVEKLKISHTISRIFQDMQIFSCISCCPVFGQWTLNFLSGSHSLRHAVSKANPFSQDKLQDAEKKFLFFINFSHRNFSSKMPNKNYTVFFYKLSDQKDFNSGCCKSSHTRNN